MIKRLIVLLLLIATMVTLTACEPVPEVKPGSDNDKLVGVWCGQNTEKGWAP